MNKLLLLFCFFLSFFTAYGIIPNSIRQGDTIAIITPGNWIKDKIVEKAILKIEERGFKTQIMPWALGRYSDGSYSAPDKLRAQDIMNAFTDPSIKAILCSRGGYGSTRLLPMLDSAIITQNPKWVIGYSDITALHAFLNKKCGMATLHGPMCGHISDETADSLSVELLFNLLTNGLPNAYDLEPNAYNKTGFAEGCLYGGNLMVLQGLSGSDFDPLENNSADIILFLEDVGEKIYAIERFMLRMHLSGALNRVKGIVFGEFTNYKADDDFETMEDMLRHRLREWGYYDKEDMPILYMFPAGHGDLNYPLIFGAPTKLNVKPEGATLIQAIY